MAVALRYTEFPPYAPAHVSSDFVGAGTRSTSRVRAKCRNAASAIFRDVTARSRIDFHCQGSPTSQKYLIETMPAASRCSTTTATAASICTSSTAPRSTTPCRRASAGQIRPAASGTGSTTTTATARSRMSPKRPACAGIPTGWAWPSATTITTAAPDLYVTNFGRNILYHNNGDGTFTDVTDKAGVGWPRQAGPRRACFVDYDNDGRLDLIVARYLEWDFSNERSGAAQHARLPRLLPPRRVQDDRRTCYHNNGDGTFTDVSEECGIGKAPARVSASPSTTTTATAGRHPDRQRRYSRAALPQLRQRHVRGSRALAGLAYDENGRTFSGMGADFADYDNDGWPDVFIGALAERKVRRCSETGKVVSSTLRAPAVAKLTSTHSGWGTEVYRLRQ